MASKDFNFALADGKILKFEINSVLKKGHEQKVYAKVKGNGKYIFLTLLLIDPKQNQQWWVDNDSIDLVKNGGKLNLKNSDYENTWHFPIFDDALTGEYTAFLGMYQDTYELPTYNRRLVDFSIKKLKVVESIESEQADVVVPSVRDDERDFEILRDRILWCICHNLISKKRRAFHAADMVDECAGAFHDEEGIKKYRLTGEHEYFKNTLEKIYKPLVDRGLIEEYEKNNYRIPEGSRLEKICKASENKAYMRWEEIDRD